MNDKFTDTPDPDDETISRKLNQVAEQTNANLQFAAELEERLRTAYQPKRVWFSSTFTQVSPTLRWVALMVLLAVVLSWTIKSLIPMPQPAVDDTPTITDLATPTPNSATNLTATTAPEQAGYDFRGARLFLEDTLPEGPARAHVYLLQKEEPAAQEEVLALADRFGIQGEMYTAPGLVYGTTDYVVSDGKQFLQVHSPGTFMYTADMAKNNRAFLEPSNPNADAIIREFLKSRGFDFPFRLYASGFFGGYMVELLAPDTIPIQYESYAQPMMRVVLDENGQVLTINASLMSYDPNPLGEYGIITAQEAFQKLLDNNAPAGKMEFSHSPSRTPRQWYREYPDAQVITLYGNVTANPPVSSNGTALVLINGIPVVGNISGMENLEYYTLVKATGQFFVEGGIRKLNVQTWDTNVELSYLSGTLHREGDRVILTSDDGSGSQYPLIDPPADLPMDGESQLSDSQVAISGVIVNEELFWTYIQYFEDILGDGGGGGGGGSGFYQLNLSGTPVPFPTPTPLANTGQGITEYVVKEGDTLLSIAEAFGIPPEELFQANDMSDPSILIIGMKLIIPGAQSNPLIGKRFEDQRGLFIVNIYRNPDGSQRTEYAFSIANENENYYLRLESEGLEELEKYHNRPVNIWATIVRADQFGGLTAKVDAFEVPFPDLPIQILKGTQKVVDIGGQSVLTFVAEDGTTYVQMGPAGDVWNEGSMFGKEGDSILVEALVVPDETFGGHPTIRVYGTAYAADPVSGRTNEMSVTADQPYVMDEDPGAENYTPPSLTITSVELVYYVRNPYYQVNDPNNDQTSPYIQPAWHFHGRYEDGSEFDVLIQALNQEFLIPELESYTGPG